MTAQTTQAPRQRTTVARSLSAVIARHPIASYLVIAFGSSWAFTGLVSVSLMFGLVALFGPAFAAIVVSRADGTSGVLRHRITDWRQRPSSYLAAFGIPFVVAAGALAIYVLVGNPAPGLGSVSAIEVMLFFLVIGEEIGWRGFLMPRLRERLSLPAAGLVTGIIWTAWHLPIYLAPDHGLSQFAAFAWWVVPFAVVMGIVAERARYSVIVATVMHGAANVSIPILLPHVALNWVLLVTGGIYLALAIWLIGRTSTRGATVGAPSIERKDVMS